MGRVGGGQKTPLGIVYLILGHIWQGTWKKIMKYGIFRTDVPRYREWKLLIFEIVTNGIRDIKAKT